MRRLALALICAGLLWTGLPATALGSDAEARAAFDDGKQLFADGEFAAAADAFRRAHRLKPNWKLLYNIGQSEAAARRYGLALETFELYLAKGGDEIGPERTEEVIGEVKRLRELVGSLEVRGPAGAVVEVDGVERGTLPLSGLVLVAAGVEHQVKVSRGEQLLLEQPVRVSGGQTRAITAEEGPSPPPGPEPAPEPEAAPAVEDDPVPDETPVTEDDDPSDPLWIAGWVTAGVGVAALAGGGVTGGMALSLDGELEGDCPDGECPPERWKDNDRLGTLATTSTALFIAGGALAATGIVLLIVSASRDDEQDVTVSLAPGGLVVGGSF